MDEGIPSTVLRGRDGEGGGGIQGYNLSTSLFPFSLPLCVWAGTLPVRWIGIVTRLALFSPAYLAGRDRNTGNQSRALNDFANIYHYPHFPYMVIADSIFAAHPQQIYRDIISFVVEKNVWVFVFSVINSVNSALLSMRWMIEQSTCVVLRNNP